MERTEKPVFLEDDIWCNTPPTGSDLQKPTQDKISTGWKYGEIPRHYTFNWSGNVSTSFCAHSNQFGIPEWDSSTEYKEGAYTLIDDSGTGRKLFVATEDNINENPLSSTSWREYSNSFGDLKDVELDNLQAGDLIKYQRPFVYDGYEYTGVWYNVPRSSFISLSDLNDVWTEDFPQNGSVLSIFDNLDFGGKFWTNNYINNLISLIVLDDFSDVSTEPAIPGDPPIVNAGDVLAYNGNQWTGVSLEGYVEYDDIFFKPGTFNPPPADPNTFGGFRTKLTNIDELEIFTSPLNVPYPPLHVNATDDLSTGVTITWDENSNGPAAERYTIYRNKEAIHTTPDNTVFSYDDNTAEFFEYYTYYVVAINSDGKSIQSNEDIGLRTDIPDAPTNFVASENLNAYNIKCTWDDVTGAISYNLYKDGDLVAAGIESPYYYYAGPNTTNNYCVKAATTVGESTCSNTYQGSTSQMDGERYMVTNGQFTVPNGITKLRICAVGGGGSGAIGEADGSDTGGGYAGVYVDRLVNVSPGDMLNIQLGEGGKHTDYSVVSDGNPGTNTIITFLNTSLVITALGGHGGKSNSKDYQGNGGRLKSRCVNGDFYDGLHSNKPNWVSCYGGQASQFGNGGSRSGQVSEFGAGGSAISKFQEEYDNPLFCNGGNGYVTIQWGESFTQTTSTN